MGGSVLFTAEELSARIARGEALFIAGEAEFLRRLPKGPWVGGTSPCLAGQGRGRAFAFGLPDGAAGAQIRRYDAESLRAVYGHAPDNGYSLIVLPAASRTLQAFALEAPRYEGFACRPLLGWVAGVELAAVGREAPLVFDGRDGTALGDAALVLHVTLPRAKSAEVGCLNIFEPGDGDVLTFPEDSFSASEVRVNGRPRRFADYVRERRLDVRLPLVADYNGAMVNISFQTVDDAAGVVRFFAPVFRGVSYRQARPVGDFAAALSSQFSEGLGEAAYACNCILNYLYGGEEGRRAAQALGPATFGEVAYQLLNQTAVFLTIRDADLAARLRGETALRRRFRDLEAQAEDLAAFNSMAAHDMRAPLRHVRAYARMIRDAAAGGDPARGLAERIEAAAARMQALLEALLAFSRAGRVPLRREAVDLGELVAEARRELEAEHPGLRVDWRVGPLPVVGGDRELLRQVVANLLSNAVKFAGGRPDPRVEVAARREEGRHVLSVRDNGVGFAPEDAARLFKPFRRLRPVSEFPGTGIGLASVARIVARHGGLAWAQGEPGRGACFCFTLPESAEEPAASPAAPALRGP